MPLSQSAPQKTALVVGRFQPFHLGHRYLLEYALQGAQELIIAIGSSNKHNQDNPLTYEHRREMLLQVMTHEGWQGKVQKIIPLPDYPDDQEWVRQLQLQAGHFDYVVGNNEWTNQVLKEAGYAAQTLPDLDRENYQGTSIREAMKSGAPWQAHVPDYLVPQISQLIK